MRLYFDTNLYRAVSAAGLVPDVASAVRQNRHYLLASGENLFETYAIADDGDRKRELAALTALASGFDPTPASYREAREVREAIHRHLPLWKRRIVHKRAIKFQLQAHQARWKEAKEGNLPRPGAYAEYRRDAEVGVKAARQMLKGFRAGYLRDMEVRVLGSFDGRVAQLPVPLDDAMRFWRYECFLAYDGALVKRNRATRDLADWLLPFINPARLSSVDFLDFWLNRVEVGDVPLAAWKGAVAYHQLEGKVTHGNPVDQQHAQFALEVDCLLTRDRAFAKALESAKKGWSQRVADIVLIEGDRDEAARALPKVLFER